MLNQSQKKSKLALTRAKLRSMHSELSYGLSFASKLQRVAIMRRSGSHQPTPDPSFSLRYMRADKGAHVNTRSTREVAVAAHPLPCLLAGMPRNMAIVAGANLGMSYVGAGILDQLPHHTPLHI